MWPRMRNMPFHETDCYKEDSRMISDGARHTGNDGDEQRSRPLKQHGVREEVQEDIECMDKYRS